MIFWTKPFPVFLWAGAKPSDCSELESFQVLVETIKSSWDCVESQRRSDALFKFYEFWTEQTGQNNWTVVYSPRAASVLIQTELKVAQHSPTGSSSSVVSQVDEGGTPLFFMAGFFNIPFLFLWSWNVSCCYMKQTYLCMTQSRKSPKFWRFFKIFKYWLHRS